MFAKIKEYFTAKFLKKYLNNLLAKLPLNGKKTETGVVVTLLGVLLSMYPGGEFLFRPVVDFLAPYADPVTLTGFFTMIIGYFHSLIKKEPVNKIIVVDAIDEEK